MEIVAGYRSLVAIAVLFALEASSCQLKAPGELLDSVPAPEITSFSISGVAGVISSNTITVDLRWGGVDVRSQAAIFVTNARNVQIDRTKQTSGATNQDYTQVRKIEAIGPDLTVRVYTVNVQFGYPFGDTGQTLCSSGASANGAMTACPNTNIGPVQNGDHANKPASRSYIGPTAPATFSSDYTTTDNTAGLIWKSCVEGLSGPACASGTAAQYALSPDAATPACNALNAANGGFGYAGRTTWRLPTIEEIKTIINFDGSSPTVTGAAFPATPAFAHWTSSTYAPSPTSSWTVNFGIGGTTSTLQTAALYVRCVANKTYSYAPLSKDNGDGTVTDQSNNLIWQKCSRNQNNDSVCSGTATQGNWLAAFTYCQSLSLAGRSWRLPSLIELMSLLDFTSAAGPAIHSSYFPATASASYWSSTTQATTPANAWYVGFLNGLTGPNTKTNNGYTRCVSGP